MGELGFAIASFLGLLNRRVSTNFGPDTVWSLLAPKISSRLLSPVCPKGSPSCVSDLTVSLLGRYVFWEGRCARVLGRVRSALSFLLEPMFIRTNFVQRGYELNYTLSGFLYPGPNRTCAFGKRLA